MRGITWAGPSAKGVAMSDGITGKQLWRQGSLMWTTEGQGVGHQGLKPTLAET